MTEEDLLIGNIEDRKRISFNLDENLIRAIDKVASRMKPPLNRKQFIEHVAWTHKDLSKIIKQLEKTIEPDKNL